MWNDRAGDRAWNSRSDTDLRDSTVEIGPQRQAAWSELVRRHTDKLLQSVRGTLIRLGRLPQIIVIEELVEATWVRVAAEKSGLLWKWKPSRGSLDVFLGRVAMYETLTWCRRAARRKELQLREDSLRKLSAQLERRLSSEELALLKESEVTVRAWKATLGARDRRVLRLRKRGAGSRRIGRFLRLDHSTVLAILSRLEVGLKRLLNRTRN